MFVYLFAQKTAHTTNNKGSLWAGSTRLRRALSDPKQ